MLRISKIENVTNLRKIKRLSNEQSTLILHKAGSCRYNIARRLTMIEPQQQVYKSTKHVEKLASIGRLVSKILACCLTSDTRTDRLVAILCHRVGRGSIFWNPIQLNQKFLDRTQPTKIITWPNPTHHRHSAIKKLYDSLIELWFYVPLDTK